MISDNLVILSDNKKAQHMREFGVNSFCARHWARGCVSASARQSRVQCRAREFIGCKILSARDSALLVVSPTAACLSESHKRARRVSAQNINNAARNMRVVHSFTLL